MIIRVAASVLAVVMTGAAALSAQGGGNAAVRAAIEKTNKKFVDGAAKGDAAVIASAYTADAIAFPANSEAVTGKPAIQKMWQSVLESGITGFELTTTEVDSAGNLAYEVGTYVLKMKDGTVADRGKYCVVWKRVNGEWLLHRDIWTTNLPAKK
jgi:ketosteroid isomerase-like protein